MNILWVSLYPPLPLNFGGPVGIYHRVKEIAKHANSIFLFYINEDGEVNYDDRLLEFCKEAHAYRRVKNLKPSFLMDCVKYPYTVATRNISKLQNDIEKCINDNHIDLINVEFPQMCINMIDIAQKKHIPIVLHEHNNEWNRFSQMADASKGLRKFLLKRESRKLHGFERFIENNGIVNYYTFLSTVDQQKHIETFGIDKKRTILVPLGGEPKELKKKTHEGIIFMFCAAMDSEMNEEAALWFTNKVFNKINNRNVFLYLVGRNPSEKVKALANERVIVTGAVDSLDDYYSMADAIVIPLLHGGGVKVKLLEAVERQKLIITTPIGNEGTLFTSEHILIAENENDFLNHCNHIISGDKSFQSLKERMNTFFLENYTWEKIGDSYNRSLEQCIKSDEVQ